MEKYLNKFYDIIDKIGKQNFLLIVFIIIVVAITGIVQTFSLYTELSGVSIVDGIKTYQFILNANNTTNTIIIPANSSKNIDITVNNDSSAKLLYGIYYTSNNNAVNIGYLPRTSHLPNATIEANSDNVVTIRVKNSSDNNASITFGVKYGFENGGELTLEEGQSWLEEYEESLDDSILANHVINLYNDGSAINTVHIGADASKPEVSLNDTQKIVLDNNGEYRYYKAGTDPNNYVLFNNELWRIISSSNVKSSTTDTKGEQRVKLVKAETLADDNGINTFWFDDLSSNNYSNSKIKTVLNDIYLTKGSGDCSATGVRTCNFSTTGINDTSRNLIDDALYYLGGVSSDTSTTGDGAYSAEHQTSATWIGKVGLVYPSDLGYSNNLTTSGSIAGSFENWLYSNLSNYVWTISPEINTTNQVIVYANGTIPATVNSLYNALPVVYLKSNVKWLSGDGSSDNPYILDDGTGGSSGGDDTTEQIQLKTYLISSIEGSESTKLISYNLILEENSQEKVAKCSLHTDGFLRCGSYTSGSSITILGVDINGTRLEINDGKFSFNISNDKSNLFLAATDKGVEEYKLCSNFNSSCDSRIT